MEKEVCIGMTPKSATHQPKKERGRTPGPSGIRLGGSRANSRAPSPIPSPGPEEGRSSSRASPSASRDVTARNSLEIRDLHDDHEREGVAAMAAHLHSAFARAVSRGRPSSRPNSRPGSRTASRSRASSPVGDRRSSLATFASTSNGQAHRSASLAPQLLASSPQLSPRDEEPPRPSIGRTTSSQSSLNAGLGSLSIGAGVERQRDANNVDGLGHPDDEDFGLNGRVRLEELTRGRHSPLSHGLGAPNTTSSGYALRGRGGLARNRESSRGPAGGSVPPSVGKQKQRESSTSGKGWTRWGRSASRARVPASSTNRSRNETEEDAAEAGHLGEVEGHHGSGAAGGLELEKGVHGFEFAFIIPANSPEYTRSPFGRVRYVIKATAYGAGRARSNVESWRDCFPVANPSTEGGPTPLTVLYNDLHPTVGLLSIACTSQNISVGGLFQLDIHSPTPPSDLIVYLIRVSLETTIEIRSKRKGRQIVPSQRNKLYEKGYVPPRKEDPHSSGDGKKSQGFIRDPAKHGADSAWTVQGLARIPDDNSIRSSTMGGTKAAIRFSHQIVVEVVHSREAEAPDTERRLKVFTLRQPITLPSCCVAFDAATLPAYTPASEDSSATRGANVDGLPYDLAHLPNGARSEQNQTTSRNAGSSSGNSAEAGSSNGQGTSGSTSAAAGAANGSRAHPNRPSTHQLMRGASHQFCVCGLSLQDLEAREQAMMMPPQSAAYDIPIDALRPHGKIGELPALGRRRSRSRSVSTRRGSASSQRSVSLAGGLGRRRSPSASGSGSGSASGSGSGPSNIGAAVARSLSRSGAGSHNGRDASTTRDGSVAGRRSGSLARVGRRGSTFTLGSTHTVSLQGGMPVSRVTSAASARSGRSLARIDDVRESTGREEVPRSNSTQPLRPQAQHGAVVLEGEEPPSYDSAVFEDDEAQGEEDGDTEQRGRRY